MTISIDALGTIWILLKLSGGLVFLNYEHKVKHFV